MQKLCFKCNQKIPHYIKIKKIRHNLQNRKYCLTCVPFKTRRGRGKYLNQLTEEEKQNRLNKIRQKNREKANRYTKKFKKEKGDFSPNLIRVERKQLIVNALGGGCMICGYNKLISNLCFHHLRDKKIALTIVAFNTPVENLLDEIKKCILICHNCHGEVHASMIDQIIIEQKNQEVIKLLKQNF